MGKLCVHIKGPYNYAVNKCLVNLLPKKKHWNVLAHKKEFIILFLVVKYVIYKYAI